MCHKITFTETYAFYIPASGEKIVSVLMKTYGHHTTAEKKGLLHAVSVMDINVDVYYNSVERYAKIWYDIKITKKGKKSQIKNGKIVFYKKLYPLIAL